MAESKEMRRKECETGAGLTGCGVMQEKPHRNRMQISWKMNYCTFSE